MLAGAIAVVLTMFSLRGGAARHTTVVASMPYWNFQHGTAAVLAHRDAATEVSPWMYGLAASGQIGMQYPAGRTVRRHPPRANLFTAVLLAVVLPDFLITCAVAVLERQPRLLLTLFFPFMRMLDAAISLYSVPAAWLSASNGRWKSPARRVLGSAATAPLPAAGQPASGLYHAGIRDEPGRPAPLPEASHVSG